jgi:lipopolysaccharide export system permease protein
MLKNIYILKNFFRNFLIIGFGLTFAAVLTDFVAYFTKIEGFNRQILYFFYNFADYFNFIYPLAIVFGALMTIFSFINKNYLVALESFGYSKTSILKPLIIGALFIYFIMVGLNFTKFAYANDSARSILKKESEFKNLENIFFKYNDNFVYAKKLDVIHKEFFDITLYIANNLKLNKILFFKKAKFNNGKWVASEVTIKKLKYKNNIPQGYTISYKKSLEILEGYYPKVIRLLYEGKRVSLSDAFKALSLLKIQKIDNSKIKSSIYSKLIMPLFAPLLIVIFFLNTPLHKRVLNSVKFLILSVGVTLIVWALFYSANMLGVNGAININLGQPLIFALLLIITVFVWLKKAK